MTRSELIVRLVQRQPHLSTEDVATATRHLLDQLSDTLARGQRIEVRGFGSFELRYRRPRFGHNPKTREPIALRGRYLPHFKPGIELCARVNGFLSIVRDFLQDDAAVSGPNLTVRAAEAEGREFPGNSQFPQAPLPDDIFQLGTAGRRVDTPLSAEMIIPSDGAGDFVRGPA